MRKKLKKARFDLRKRQAQRRLQRNETSCIKSSTKKP